MATWRVARSLDQLLAQLNGVAPRRSKLSDGSVGDASHASRSSDHNPWYGPGIVTARDYTHDPRGGLDCNRLAEALVASRDPRIKYIIWNRRIIDSRPGCKPWQWCPYSGPNPHTKHLHLSVMATPAADDIRPWALPGLSNVPAPRLAVPDTSEEDEMAAVSLILPAGMLQKQPVGVPPHVPGSARIYLSTGWTVAKIRNGYFIRDRGPGLSPHQEGWGGTGSFDLVPDDRPSWPLPEGCTQVSWEYDSQHPLAVVITYKPV